MNQLRHEVLPLECRCGHLAKLPLNLATNHCQKGTACNDVRPAK